MDQFPSTSTSTVFIFHFTLLFQSKYVQLKAVVLQNVKALEISVTVTSTCTKQNVVEYMYCYSTLNNQIPLRTT